MLVPPQEVKLMGPGGEGPSRPPPPPVSPAMYHASSCRVRVHDYAHRGQLDISGNYVMYGTANPTSL